MIALLRAECRKLFTVRSTYVISILALLLVAFLAFYVEGFKGLISDPNWLVNLISNVSTTISIFIAITAILLMGHEYRYNTIMYTLTSANSRTKVLLAKIITVAWYAVAFTLITWVLAALSYWLGTAVSPHPELFVAPDFLWSEIWQSLFFVVAYALMALFLVFLFRHVVGAIAALFILPTVEALLTALLKDNAKYLPFGTLEQVHTGAIWSPSAAAFLFTAYLVGAWLIAWYLFIRRDAN